MNLKQIDAAIKGIAARYSSTRKKVQEVAVAIIAHAEGEGRGDCTRAVRLVRAVAGTSERNKLIGWFALYSPIGITLGKTAKDDKCRLKKPDSKGYNNYNLDGARANMWYDDPAKTDNVKPLSTLDEFSADIFKIIENRIKSIDDKVAPEDRPSALRLLNALRATYISTKGEIANQNAADHGIAPRLAAAS